MKGEVPQFERISKNLAQKGKEKPVGDPPGPGDFPDCRDHMAGTEGAAEPQGRHQLGYNPTGEQKQGMQWEHRPQR